MTKVFIIGAGVAGLSAAIRLQSNGYDVEIFEQLDMAGGKMHYIKDRGHTFDVGPTIVMWPEAYTDVFEMAGANPADYIEFIDLDPMYEVVFRDSINRHYKMTNNLMGLMAIMESKGQDTASGFVNYLSDMYERFLVAKNSFIRRPFRHKSDIYNPHMIKEGLKLKTFDTANNMMANYIDNQDVQQMLAFQTLYIGVSPQQGPSLYNMMPMLELFYGIKYIKGGMHAMARAMVRLFQELGGKIHYNCPVDEIMIKNQAVQGIRIGNKMISADYVISNADFPYTITQLVQDPKARGKYTPDYVDNMDYSCSCLVFYWGMDADYSHLETHTFVISEDLDKNLTEIFDGSLIEDPSILITIASNADPDAAPEGKSSFYVLIPVPHLGIAKYDYDEPTIDYYREKILSSLEQVEGLDHIRQDIYFEHRFTPNDFKQQFSAYNGATFGLQPTLKQSAHLRPQSKAKHCDGLYFTGSSTHPGAGVPTAMEGGRIAADELRLDVEGVDYHIK